MRRSCQEIVGKWNTANAVTRCMNDARVFDEELGVWTCGGHYNRPLHERRRLVDSSNIRHQFGVVR